MNIVNPLKSLALALTLVSSAQIVASEPLQEFRDNFEQLLQQHNLPGAVVHIKHNNQLVMHEAFGVINLESKKPVNTDNIYRIFSMTKPLTAVALLQLVDKGLVKLDEDIRTYLPEFEPFEYDGEPQIVTVHQLLTHTAGFGYGGGLNNWVDIRYLFANPLSRSNTLHDMVDDLSGIELKFKPGERFEYSIASDIQGAIIEAVTKQSLREYFQTNLLTPLDMGDTQFEVEPKKAHRLVDMYEYDAGTFEEAYVFNEEKILFVESAEESDYLESPILLSGGGGLVSTAKDYANFVTMLLNKGEFNGKRILSETLAAQMLSSHTQGLDTHFMPRVYQGVGFGYGVGVKEISGDIREKGTFFWGGMGGTIFWADPKADLQVVVMFQVEDGWIAMEKWMIPNVYQLLDSLRKEKV